MSGLTSPGGNISRQQQIDQAVNALGGRTPAPSAPSAPDKPRDHGPVSTQAIQQAAAQAARTGLPQPVRAASGQIVFYVDYSGAVVPDAIAQDQLRSAGKGDTFQPSQQSGPRAGDNLSAAQQNQINQQSASYQAQQSAGALKDQTAQLGMGSQVWVNGHMRVVTGFHSDGTPIIGYQGLSGSTPPGVIDPVTGMPMANGVETAFDALHLGATYGPTAGISGTDQFTMAIGPTDVITGMPADRSNYTPAGVGLTPAAAEHSYSANVASNGQSNMTIAQGVQWVANLSNQNPAAYDQLVKELKHAGYTGAQGEPLTGGGYSETVGVAAAKAFKDLSVMQNTTGATVGLDQFLKNRQDAVQQAAMDTYQPTNRDMASNATMMSAAKSAAQDAIGRNLTPDELAAFERSFQGKQSSYYNQIDAAGRAQAGARAIGESAPGANVVTPDVSTEASGLVQGSQFGQERANYSAQNYYQAIAQMFGIK